MASASFLIDLSDRGKNLTREIPVSGLGEGVPQDQEPDPDLPDPRVLALCGFLRSLAHPARLLALEVAASRPLSSTELARVLHIEQSTAWKHLQGLRDLGLLVEGQEGRGGSLVTDLSRLREGVRDVQAELARVLTVKKVGRRGMKGVKRGIKRTPKRKRENRRRVL